jgi:hypothetical protein
MRNAGLAVSMHSDAPFPLTPPLSLSEREHTSSVGGYSLSSEHFPALRRVPPLPKGLPLPTSPPVVSQSQRDCVLQPRVASSELPWERGVQKASNPNGVAASSDDWRPQPRWGWRLLVQFTQGSSLLATLGFETESLWDSSARRCDLWGMLSPKGEGWGEGEHNRQLHGSGLVLSGPRAFFAASPTKPPGRTGMSARQHLCACST